MKKFNKKIYSEPLLESENDGIWKNCNLQFLSKMQV